MPLINYFIISVLSLTIVSCGVKSYNSDSQPVSHLIWDNLLQQYVSMSGKVDYKGFMKDSILFNKYLNLLKNNHPNSNNWSKDERLAYWINAYNAFTVKLVSDHYPLESIKNIKNGIPFVNTVWDIKFIKIEGAVYDLNNIEHGIIRKEFGEPRIHFAVNCASISCPKLSNEAFVAEKLEVQLATATRNFLKDETKNILSPEKVQLSKIFSWFRTDFKNEGGVIKFIQKYTPIDIIDDADKSYLDYNWNLNGIKPKSTS